MFKSFYFTVLRLLVCMMMAGAIPLYAQVSDAITQIIEEGPASDARWSVVVTDEEGVVIEDYNSRKLIRPASIQKLILSAAFLHTLGPDYRYETTLYGVGSQEGGIWNGDLVIRGKGDPSINSDFHNDPLFLFEKWASLLDSLGIHTVGGDIVGNESFFDDVPYPQGWEWNDLTFYYGVEVNALSFNKNVVNLEVLTDGEPGSAPEIRWYPFNTPFVEFVNEQVIDYPNSEYDESYRRIPGTNTIVLRSSLPQGYYETEPLSVTRASLYFLDTFKRYLERSGIRVTGRLLAEREQRNWSEPDYQVLDIHRSVPLYRILEEKVRNSDNFYAEMILKTLGAERFSTEGSTESGIQAVKEFLHSAGMDTSKVIMRDGSGMASANLVSAWDLNHLLYELKSMDHFDRFYNSLAVAGSLGTLQYRFRNSPVRERFSGKTGFVTGVRTLSGYLNTRSGREIIVTIATNNHSLETRVVDRLHQHILEYLYSVY